MTAVFRSMMRHPLVTAGVAILAFGLGFLWGRGIAQGPSRPSYPDEIASLRTRLKDAEAEVARLRQEIADRERGRQDAPSP